MMCHVHCPSCRDILLCYVHCITYHPTMCIAGWRVDMPLVPSEPSSTARACRIGLRGWRIAGWSTVAVDEVVFLLFLSSVLRHIGGFLSFCAYLRHSSCMASTQTHAKMVHVCPQQQQQQLCAFVYQIISQFTIVLCTLYNVNVFIVSNT